MIVDANLLIYAVDESSPHHETAKDWLTTRINGDARVAIPWQSIAAFLRITTHPRASVEPLSPELAWSIAEDWLEMTNVWSPLPGPGYPAIIADLFARHSVAGNMVPDAMLAGLAIEHGLTICSADTDFARFTDAKWVNPLN
jgi:toxin-antitoxin system PIN domain toxin